MWNKSTVIFLPFLQIERGICPLEYNPLARLQDKDLHLGVDSANDPEGVSETSIEWRKSVGFLE